jgi:flagellar motor switch protein FliG
MTLTGKKKAAMLLMSLDAATAAELVKDLDADVVQELAVELASLDAAGFKSGNKSSKIVRQFHHSLQAGETFRLNSFLDEVLKSTVGEEKAGQIQTQIQDILCNRDPFVSICSVDSQTLALVLGSEHPQTIAVVLSELPAPKKLEVLNFLDGCIRVSVIGRMSDCKTVTAEAKALVAEEVCERLNAIAIHRTGEPLPFWSEQSLRKAALIVRDLDKEIRDGLLSAIRDKDSRAGEMVAELMVIWADISQVTDKSLQEVLGGVDANKLALALHDADKAIAEKIRSNLSERAVAAVDEQASLISAPGGKDIEGAREQIVRIMREMNEKSGLTFMEEGCDVRRSNG